MESAIRGRDMFSFVAQCKEDLHLFMTEVSVEVCDMCPFVLVADVEEVWALCVCVCESICVRASMCVRAFISSTKQSNDHAQST